MSGFPIPITTIFSGLLALMLVGISIRVTVLRAKKKIEFFDGGDQQLGRAIRVQGNFVEYVPMALILLGLIEWMGRKPWIVYALGIALVLSRIIHAWGLYSGVFNGRVVGTTITWIVLAVAGLLALSVVA